MSTKPQLPAEIQALILREASEIISFPDLWRARAVNSFFASEIEAIVTKAIRGKCSNRCFSSGHNYNSLSGYDRQIQVRRLFLYLKTKEYPREPTVWSCLVDDILGIPNDRTTEETEAFLNKLIDAWLCDTAESRWAIMGKAQPKYKMSLSWHWTEIYNHAFRRWRVTDRINLSFAINAFRRGRRMEMQALLDQQTDVERLVKKSNTDGLKTWIEYLKMTERRRPTFLNPAITEIMAHGVPEILGFIQDEWEAAFTGFSLGAHMFKRAIGTGSLETIKYLYTSGRLDLNMRTGSDSWPHGPLQVVIQQAPRSTRLEILRYLLQQGADPNGPNWAKRTPFEDAVFGRDVESAKVLLQHGATFEIGCVKKALLFSATRWRMNKQPCDAMAQLLWPNGEVVSPYKKGGKCYVFSRVSITIGNIEKVFLGLGWSDDEVQGMQWNYFIDVVEDFSGFVKK